MVSQQALANMLGGSATAQKIRRKMAEKKRLKRKKPSILEHELRPLPQREKVLINKNVHRESLERAVLYRDEHFVYIELRAIALADSLSASKLLPASFLFKTVSKLKNYVNSVRPKFGGNGVQLYVWNQYRKELIKKELFLETNTVMKLGVNLDFKDEGNIYTVAVRGLAGRNSPVSVTVTAFNYYPDLVEELKDEIP